MKIPAKCILIGCSLVFGGVAAAQEHAITYNKKNRSVDATVTIAGQTHKMVRLPVRDFENGNRYGIIFPAPSLLGLFTSGTVTTTHNTGPFESHLNIDGYPAQIHLSDGIGYSVTGDGQGDHTFIAAGIVSVTVTIDVGGTHVSLFNSLEMVNASNDMAPITSASLGPTANAVPAAKWNKYKDPTDLVTALDKWIDFIRIAQL